MFKSIITVAAAAALALTSVAAPAQAAWPERPVKFMLGSAAGSSIDMIGRIIIQELTERFGQPFVAQNITGGGLGMFAMTLKNAPADGYTIGFGSDVNFTNNSHDPNAKFKMEDFKPICTVFNGDTSIIVNVDRPWKDLREALEASKTTPITYYFQSAMDRKLMEGYVEQVPGAQVKLIPEKSPTQIVSNLIGGHGDIGLSGGLHYEQARAGKVRTLTMTTSERMPNYPDVPTVTELGFKTVPTDAYRCVIVRAGFPAEAEEALAKALEEICTSPKFKEQVDKLHFTVRYHNPAETAEIFAKQYNDFSFMWQ
ncbi:MAG: tripartite tricarboxylate transporter substrate binding protein [Mailhella sp.]|nr:tripartite tricarboxylate transporter substrate binding protein [Mailhella sp.]